MDCGGVVRAPSPTMRDTQQVIAKRLIALRNALGVNDATICRNIDVAANRWSQYLDPHGKRTITLDVAVRLRKRYGVPLDWIYLGDESGLPRGLSERLLNHPASRVA